MNFIPKLLVITQLISVVIGFFIYPFSIWSRTSVTTCSGPLAPTGRIHPGQLIFEDKFDKFDLNTWKHSLTLSGKGAYDFQWFDNNRSNSFVQNGKLHIRPTLVADIFGEDFLTQGRLNIYGASPNAR